jgi:hypothetical protein
MSKAGQGQVPLWCLAGLAAVFWVECPNSVARRPGTRSSTPRSVSSTCSALLVGIDYSDRSCCSISTGSCADQRLAARVTSSRFRSFTRGTSRNITTVVRPCPLRRARSVARRKPLSSSVCLLNKARNPSTTSRDGPLCRDTNRSGPKRCSGNLRGLIRLPSVPFRGVFSVGSRESARAYFGSPHPRQTRE